MPTHSAFSSLVMNINKWGVFGEFQAVPCPLIGRSHHSSEMAIRGVFSGCIRQYHAHSWGFLISLQKC